MLQRREKSPAKVNRRTVAEIDLGSLLSNFGKIKHIVGSSRVIAVVKADAYGHGAVTVAQTLVREGVHALGVAFVAEAIELRDAGIRAPVLVFFDNEHVAEFFDYDLTPVLFEESALRRFSEHARTSRRSLDVHIEVDTGMGRVGILPERLPAVLDEIRLTQGIRLRGIMSHFSEADLHDKSFAKGQLSLFATLQQRLKKEGFTLTAHIANSAAVLTMREAQCDAVRPGLMLYGYSPLGNDGGLLPVMMVKTEIISLRRVPAGTPISYGRTFITQRPSLIAVLPVGYADGYSRSFSNNADVLVSGKKAPVVGRVCMDIIMIDVTGHDDVEIGDEVILLSNDPASGLTAFDLAVRAGTIPYEILTSLGIRARRNYIASE